MENEKNNGIKNVYLFANILFKILYKNNNIKMNVNFSHFQYIV